VRLAWRLGLALVVLVAGPLAVVYFSVVPSLETRLVSSKVHRVQHQIGTIANLYQSGLGTTVTAKDLNDQYPSYRVTILTPAGQRLNVTDDSATIDSSDVSADPIARRASQTGRIAAGTVVRHRTHYAEAAKVVAIPDLPVVLISTPIQGELDDIQLVKRRILLAGAAALLAALALGFTAASLHVRRIRRLERAADRIAHGEFGEPVVDRGSDELTDLANAFEHMRRRLAALDGARREFVANASHELRTPIFALGAALELLEDEELDDETRDEFLETMRDQVARLTRMTADLLDLTRMDAGRMPVEAEPVDLNEAAEVLGREFDAAARAGGRRLAVETNGAVTALADSDQVLRIGRAVVENALVHTPPGTSVRIVTRSVGRRVALEVVDDGPGVPAEQGEQVFERFYRGEGTRASGSGLGLAIAHELAELMHGELELDGRTGTRVTLVLPADPEA
jgi:two-component system OmpR family sensor kinase